MISRPEQIARFYAGHAKELLAAVAANVHTTDRGASWLATVAIREAWRLAFLSLLGLPPLSGFFGKLEVFKAALDADQAWLAVVAVANTVVSLFYYLRVVAPAVLDSEKARGTPRSAGAPLAAALAVCTVAAVGFGVGAEPLLRLADSARMLAG